MANNTVPTIDHQTIPTKDTPQGTIPIERAVTSSVPDYGVETVTLYGNQTAPEYWTGICAWISLHANGSLCRHECGCVAKADQTKIPDGQPTAVGDWVWSTHRSGVVVGWNRTGPSDTETALQKRIDILEEDLDHEAGHRQLAEEDLAALTGRTERLRASLRRIRKDYRGLDRLASVLLRAAVSGWTAAIALALILIEVSS